MNELFWLITPSFSWRVTLRVLCWARGVCSPRFWEFYPEILHGLKACLQIGNPRSHKRIQDDQGWFLVWTITHLVQVRFYRKEPNYFFSQTSVFQNLELHPRKMKDRLLRLCWGLTRLALALPWKYQKNVISIEFQCRSRKGNFDVLIGKLLQKELLHQKSRKRKNTISLFSLSG